MVSGFPDGIRTRNPRGRNATHSLLSAENTITLGGFLIIWAAATTEAMETMGRGRDTTPKTVLQHSNDLMTRHSNDLMG